MGTESHCFAKYLCTQRTTHTGHKLKCRQEICFKIINTEGSFLGWHKIAQQSKSEAGKVLLLIMRKIILMSKFNSRFFECARMEISLRFNFHRAINDKIFSHRVPKKKGFISAAPCKKRYSKIQTITPKKEECDLCSLM
jgi:hypothetical protein